MFVNKRRHSNEKPVCRKERVAPGHTTREKPVQQQPPSTVKNKTIHSGGKVEANGQTHVTNQASWSTKCMKSMPHSKVALESWKRCTILWSSGGAWDLPSSSSTLGHRKYLGPNSLLCSLSGRSWTTGCCIHPGPPRPQGPLLSIGLGWESPRRKAVETASKPPATPEPSRKSLRDGMEEGLLPKVMCELS